MAQPRPAEVGVLLVNLGSPDSPTKGAVRRYLKEFLWDPRIVDLPRPLWWLILNGIILNTRPTRSAHAYRKIWTERGSPLIETTRLQAESLGRALGEVSAEPAKVAFAMRYGSPSVRSGLDSLMKEGCRRVLVIPLYPQYSATTTASTADALFAAFRSMRRIPELRTVASFHDHPLYIRALARTVEAAWADGVRPDRLLMSFHGLPERHGREGDPYEQQCRQTGGLLAEALGLEEEEFVVAFQSRFGREEWVKPYTDETLRALPASGVKSVDVICPGFVSDCLETLEEVAIQNREVFLKAGGERYRYIPCLNDRPDFTALLLALCRTHLAGWAEIRV